MLAKPSGKEEDRVGEDGRWNILVPFALVANMDETMIYAHLEFIRRLVAIALIFIKFFEALQGCSESETSGPRRDIDKSSLFINCCSSNAIENPVRSRSKCSASIWKRAQRSWHSMAKGPVSCCIVKSFLKARERSRMKSKVGEKPSV